MQSTSTPTTLVAKRDMASLRGATLATQSPTSFTTSRASQSRRREEDGVNVRDAGPLDARRRGSRGRRACACSIRRTARAAVGSRWLDRRLHAPADASALTRLLRPTAPTSARSSRSTTPTATATCRTASSCAPSRLPVTRRRSAARRRGARCGRRGTPAGNNRSAAICSSKTPAACRAPCGDGCLDKLPSSVRRAPALSLPVVGGRLRLPSARRRRAAARRGGTERRLPAARRDERQRGAARAPAVHVDAVRDAAAAGARALRRRQGGGRGDARRVARRRPGARRAIRRAILRRAILRRAIL